MRHFIWAACLLLACDPAVTPRGADGGLPDGGGPADGSAASDAGPLSDAGPQPDAGPPVCVGAVHCAPRIIDALPYLDGDDTSDASLPSAIDRYGCAPGTDESGAEIVYQVDIESVGLLGAQVRTFSADVDVDVHLLGGPSPATDCLARAHRATNALVEPGRYYVVVDTFADSGGPLAGAYELEVRFREVPEIDCATTPTDLSMFWSGCAASIDCSETAGGVFLHTPAVGPVVLEAHLVTLDDPFDGWPSAAFDMTDGHYALSQAATNYVMDRDQAWAPFGEGGSQWGQGSTGGRVPVDDEAFYLNMYWRDRPAGGTRMLAREPVSGLAVVVSAGWETGPGSNTAIGGVTEEVHDYLGTTHLDPLELGFLTDQSAPLGPVRCRE